MHSSQNEQDNRHYARFTRIPCLDPADSQEAKDFTLAAIELSEKFDTPVILRLTTRICHTSTPVITDIQRKHPDLPLVYPRNPAKYVMIPGNARKRHPVIEKRIIEIAEYAESYPLNRIEKRSQSLGIITSGVAYQYAREVFPDASILKLGMVYPMPKNSILNFSKIVDQLIVLEELDPFIEEQVRLMGVKLYSAPDNNGRDGYYVNKKSIFPICGELDPGIVRKSAIEAGLLPEEEIAENPTVVNDLPMRPPVLCPGCPHRSTFYPLHKLGLPINGDIGCYTLGVIPPLSAIDTCGCMGASIGVAHGAAVAGDNERHIAVIGDSTFFHTGIPALINVAYNKSNVITIILDNRTTGMTGHQENPGTGSTLQGLETVEVDIEALVRAIGIKQVKTIDGYDIKEIEQTLKIWLKLDEPAVLIAQHECALLPAERRKWMSLDVLSEVCNGCGLCFRIGCPAILESEELDAKYLRPLAIIDPVLCTGCEICAQICPRDAILFRDQISVGGE
ncbi:MAG: thiamine pyrophosphate-dependent enzyme, partial [Anaerolineales bacterium]|nr:thiamine pyrophosphate-dependent enzyme [Anaerolineales bacterium]